MNWKEVTISKVTTKGTITKKVFFPENSRTRPRSTASLPARPVSRARSPAVTTPFPENSIYFTICREIEEMERKESSGSQNQSGRKSSRRK